MKQYLVQSLWLLTLLMFWPVVLFCPVAIIICSCLGIWLGTAISGSLFVLYLLGGVIVDIKERGVKKHMLDMWFGINFKEDNNE